MNYSFPQVVTQEIPNEISLALSISGCPLQCPGCHSPFTWNPTYGKPLTTSTLEDFLLRYEGMITCVLFYGGEWEKETLKQHLTTIREHGLLTALYTGQNMIEDDIATLLDFVKLGPWISARGGLNSPTTNQRLIDLRTGECLNRYFHQEEQILPEKLKQAI